MLNVKITHFVEKKTSILTAFEGLNTRVTLDETQEDDAAPTAEINTDEWGGGGGVKG